MAQLQEFLRSIGSLFTNLFEQPDWRNIVDPQRRLTDALLYRYEKPQFVCVWPAVLLFYHILWSGGAKRERWHRICGRWVRRRCPERIVENCQIFTKIIMCFT